MHVIHLARDATVVLHKHKAAMGTKATKQQVNPVTGFEELSNELIYLVFDYLTFRDICSAFGRLNQRLDDLIDSHTHYLNLQQHTHSDVATFPRRIRSIKINTRQQFSFVDVAYLHCIQDLLLSNIPSVFLLHIFQTVPLHNLQYIYLGACPGNHEFEETQLTQVQEIVLSLGQRNLRRCVFRTQLYAHVDRLPEVLPTLMHLRVDGCATFVTVMKLLDRMPNLESLRVSVLDSTLSAHNKLDDVARRCHPLTYLTLRLHDWRFTDALTPLLTRYCSNVRKFTIALDPAFIHHISHYRSTSIHVSNLRQWVTTSIEALLPHLTIFHLHQHVFVYAADVRHILGTPTPYREVIVRPSDHGSYRVSVDSHLRHIWDGTS